MLMNAFTTLSPDPSPVHLHLHPIARTKDSGWIAPVDRTAASEGVRLAYGAVGLSPPRIIWREGPIELAKAWACALTREDVGANVRAVVIDPLLRRAERRIDVSLVRQRQPNGIVRDRSSAVSAAIECAVVEAAGAIGPSLLAWLRGRGFSGTGMEWHASFSDAGCGPHVLHTLANAPHLDDTRIQILRRHWRGLSLVANNAGWVVPHERVCWLAERPSTLRSDKLGRLHCVSGPALQYEDGWALHAWKGVSVPSWLITQPERITLAWIDAQIDPRIRHAMIDIFTPERFIDARGADRFSHDESGTLWKRRWSHRGTTIDHWAALELAGEKRSFHCVPPELSSPRAALAWLLATATNPAFDIRIAGRINYS